MIKKIATISIVLASTIAYAQLGLAKEPKNLYLVKQTLIKYHDSGEYQKDQSKVVDQAMLYLKNRLANEKKTNSDKKLAIVLDIDETSLSNYPDMLRLNFGGTFGEIDNAENHGNDPVIEPTLKLYNYAKANNVAVFFVTGRTDSSKDPTMKNLVNAGYQKWDGLQLKPENYHEKSASIYKIGEREKIEKLGYDIVLNMGDQESDLMGGHADKTFKLPNPYYFIP